MSLLDHIRDIPLYKIDSFRTPEFDQRSKTDANSDRFKTEVKNFVSNGSPQPYGIVRVPTISNGPILRGTGTFVKYGRFGNVLEKKEVEITDSAINPRRRLPFVPFATHYVARDVEMKVVQKKLEDKK